LQLQVNSRRKYFSDKKGLPQKQYLRSLPRRDHFVAWREAPKQSLNLQRDAIASPAARNDFLRLLGQPQFPD